ncbi:MAG: (2Fe-2S)-binding protein [Parvibaculum sp.]|uniref:bacterioferritin-associated ferredoxin n=1 Tax=Parvibaculum sp. TaxID=2024848 RepID=UPI00349FED5D
MIVCVCNAKSDRTAREALACGPHIDTPAALHRAMGCKPQCGRCLPSLAELIAEARADATLAGLMAAAD